MRSTGANHNSAAFRASLNTICSSSDAGSGSAVAESVITEKAAMTTKRGRVSDLQLAENMPRAIHCSMRHDVNT